MNKFQQIMVVSIPGSQLNFRSDIEGWSFECGNEDFEMVHINPDIHVGSLHSGRKMNCPKTIAHALRMGWNFLSSSSFEENRMGNIYKMIKVIMVRNVDRFGNPI